MTRRWAVNASPIITLAKIGRVDLLIQLCDQLVIPQGVADEIQNSGYNDPAVTWIRNEGQKYIKPVDSIAPQVASWDLGMGESYVMSWLISHPDFDAIIDDRAARKAATVLGLSVRGTISIIAIAKREGYISSARDEYEKLIDVGFRISSDVLLKALKLAGE
ncbi:putative nucleic acid-binding protein [Leptolyngbya sp. PCC 7375]|nr:putative nucleic acid-binding protein [Leptolyngbya sp. PCC 7375]